MNVVVFAEDALAPTAALWDASVAHVARKLGRVKPLDAGALPRERAAAIPALDHWAGGEVSTWRAEIGRFFEEHVPVYLRPDPALNATLRRLRAAGIRVGCWSPGPLEATRPLVHFLGVARRLDDVVCDPDPSAAATLAARLGAGPGEAVVVAASAPPLAAAAEAGQVTVAALWTGADAGALAAVARRTLRRPDELLELVADAEPARP
jgi:phosphoglycolate phosphatase-like HAD superfamily hydrolase